MTRIGLTGTLGAGKSTVGRLFEAWGARRIDADALAREAVAPGTEGLRRIREAWGEVVLDREGALDRAAMRRLVGEDREARARLEAIVHPAVGALRERRLAEAREAGAAVVVEEVPLLFEVGMTGEFDAVVVVDAPRDVRRRRVTEERGLSAEEFDTMDAAQWPADRKRRGGDHVIENDGTLEALERRARTVWEAIVGEPAADAAG